MNFTFVSLIASPCPIVFASLCHICLPCWSFLSEATVFFVWLMCWVIWIMKLTGPWKFDRRSRYDQHVALVYVAPENSWPIECSLDLSNWVLTSILEIWVSLDVLMKCTVQFMHKSWDHSAQTIPFAQTPGPPARLTLMVQLQFSHSWQG